LRVSDDPQLCLWLAETAAMLDINGAWPSLEVGENTSAVVATERSDVSRKLKPKRSGTNMYLIYLNRCIDL